MNPCVKEEEFRTLHERLDTLDEMKPLIPTLKKIVEAEEAKTWLSIKVANGLKVFGIIVGIFASGFAILWAIYNNTKK